MVIWHLPGRKGMAGIVVVSALAGLVGYLRGGTDGAILWGAVVFVALLVAGWLWSTMESYTEGS